MGQNNLPPPAFLLYKSHTFLLYRHSLCTMQLPEFHPPIDSLQPHSISKRCVLKRNPAHFLTTRSIKNEENWT